MCRPDLSFLSIPARHPHLFPSTWRRPRPNNGIKTTLNGSVKATTSQSAGGIRASKQEGKKKHSLYPPIHVLLILNLTFLTSEQGRRKKSSPAIYFGCLLQRNPQLHRAASPSRFPTSPSSQSRAPPSLKANASRPEPESREQAGERIGRRKHRACWSSCWLGAAAWWCSSTAPASSSARSSRRATPSRAPSASSASSPDRRARWMDGSRLRARQAGRSRCGDGRLPIFAV